MINEKVEERLESYDRQSRKQFCDWWMDQCWEKDERDDARRCAHIVLKDESDYLTIDEMLDKWQATQT